MSKRSGKTAQNRPMTVQAPIASESRCVCLFPEKPVFYPKTAHDTSDAGGFGEKTIAVGSFRAVKPGIPCLVKMHLIGECKQATFQLVSVCRLQFE